MLSLKLSVEGEALTQIERLIIRSRLLHFEVTPVDLCEREVWLVQASIHSEHLRLDPLSTTYHLDATSCDASEVTDEALAHPISDPEGEDPHKILMLLAELDERSFIGDTPIGEQHELRGSLRLMIMNRIFVDPQTYTVIISLT